MIVPILLLVATLSLSAQQPAAPAPPSSPGSPVPGPATSETTPANPSASSDDPSTKQATEGAPPATVDPDAIGVSIDRIQKAVTRPQAIKLTETKPVFRVSVFGDKPRIEDILGPDYLKGPVPYAGMSHQDFLDIVTPKDVQGYAAFSNTQGMIVAATSIALKWALQKAIDKYQDAKDERAKEAARREVEDALEALRKARRDAGLPEK